MYFACVRLRLPRELPQLLKQMPDIRERRAWQLGLASGTGIKLRDRPLSRFTFACNLENRIFLVIRIRLQIAPFAQPLERTVDFNLPGQLRNTGYCERIANIFRPKLDQKSFFGFNEGAQNRPVQRRPPM